MAAYNGLYRARATKLQGTTLTAYIPQVFGNTPVLINDFVGDPPTPPTMGWVAFHGGSAEIPVWLGTPAASGNGGGSGGGISEADADIRYVNVDGDAMLGALLLAGNPSIALEAAPKQYIDAATALFTTTVKGTVPPPTTVTGKFLKDDGTWATAGGGGTPTSRLINTTAPLSGGGDLSVDRTLTLLDDGVTNAKLANMATQTVKGRNTAGTGDPEDVPIATVKTMLSLTKSDVGLGNVDNTADTAKPVSTAQQTALDLKQDKSQTINAQTGTSYTLVLTDNGKIVTLSNAAAIAVTVPTNASVLFPIGSSIDFVLLGAGQATWSGTPTIRKSAATAKSRAQYSVVTIVKIATDEWVLTGDLAAT